MAIAISGYYGFDNAGDEAILMSLVREAKKRGIEPVVLSANPKRTEELHEVAAVPRFKPSAIKTLATSSGLLSGGGGLLQNKTSNKSLLYYLSIIALAQAARRPTWIFGQSLGPLSPGARTLTSHVLKRSRAVVVRDKHSLKLAQEMGIKEDRLFLGADAAILLEPPQVRREENLITLIPRGKLANQANLLLREVAQKLRSLNFEVLVLGLQPGYDEDALDLFAGFNREISGDPRRVQYLLAQSSYVLSLRLHGLILAAAAGTPYAGGNYDPKILSFCRETGAPYWDLPGDPDAITLMATRRLEPNKKAIRELKLRAASSFDFIWGTS